MQDKPYSYILFIITLIVSFVDVIWIITGRGIQYETLISPAVLSGLIAHWISLLISPVGLYSAIKFKPQNETEARFNKIGLWGNLFFTAVMFIWICIFIYLGFSGK